MQININTEYIKLDSLLKFAGIAVTGGDAKLLIQSGKVMLDNEIVTQRGKKIRDSDVITVNGEKFEVVCQKTDAEQL